MCVRLAAALPLLVLLMACEGAATSPSPVTVEPGSDRDDDRATRTARETQATSPDPDGRRPRPGASSGGIWVVDAAGAELGILFRRGSDDNIAHRAIYDIVTVYHPGSGLFFEVTMTDARVRYPATTFFQGSWCGDPVGVGVGGCDTCRAGYGIGLLHGDAWWKAVEGSEWEQATAGSSHDAGVHEDCTAHATFNAKVFPVEPVVGPAPPVGLIAPLRLEWR